MKSSKTYYVYITLLNLFYKPCNIAQVHIVAFVIKYDRVNVIPKYKTRYSLIQNYNYSIVMAVNNSTIRTEPLSWNLTHNVLFLLAVSAGFFAAPVCFAMNSLLLRYLTTTNLMHSHISILMISQCLASVISSLYIWIKMIGTVVLLVWDEQLLGQFIHQNRNHWSSIFTAYFDTVILGFLLMVSQCLQVLYSTALPFDLIGWDDNVMEQLGQSIQRFPL